MRRLIVLGLVGVFSVCSNGCQTAKGGDDFTARAEKHWEEHVLKFYKQFNNFHKDIDLYFFDLDEEDPDNY